MPANDSSIIRAAIYARVSSEEQREGQTIDSQIAELERFASSQQWVVVGIYKDEGWSGAVLARPELDRLRDDASHGRFDLVLLNDVDRLARDVSHLGIIKRDLERHGATVRFRKLPADQSPTANLMVNILGSFAEFERELIADRTRRGRRHKVEVRQQYLGSIAPYGYRYVPKDSSAGKEGYLEIVPEQAAMTRQIYKWVDEEGLSARAVVRRLNDLHIPPRKGGEQWAKSSVLRILRCETYAGVWHYNKHESYEPPAGGRFEYRRSKKCRLRLRPREEWITVNLSPELRIIERERWERVQMQLLRNSSFARRNDKHSYLLKGLVQCGGCRARYVGDPNHGRFYYRCHQRCKSYPTIREELLDHTVWEAVKEAMLNPKIIINQIRYREENAEVQRSKFRLEVNAIAHELRKVDEEEARVLEAYRTGVLTPAVLGRELEQLGVRRSSLTERRAALPTSVQEKERPNIYCSIEEFTRDAAGRIDSFSVPERQRFLQLLVDHIVYEGERLTIKGVIPIKPIPDEIDAERERRKGPGMFPSDRIAATETDHCSRNSVEAIPFEIAKSISVWKPFWDNERLSLVRALAQEKPELTLRDLRERLQLERGLSVTNSQMFRALKQLGLRRKERCLPQRLLIPDLNSQFESMGAVSR